MDEMAMKRQFPEDAFTIQVADFFRAQCPNIIWLHVPNGGKRNPREGARFKRMGVLAGAPDFLLWWKGGHGAIELKCGANKQQPSQKQFEYNYIFLGGKYAVCYSIEDVQAVLRAWGVLKVVTDCPPAYAIGSVMDKYTARPRGK